MLFDQIMWIFRRDHIDGVLRAIYRTSSFHEAFSQRSRPMNWAKDAINVVPTKYPY